ncbi:helicase HerA domain-containing protein [Tsukamurella soli]|uniref:FtsK domain-containing protein n=1 Tax=Tsukamurella soli TaxID=644556 RepID=A0ABP8KBU0_9ACTN
MTDYVNPFASYVEPATPAEPAAETPTDAPASEPDAAAEQAAQAAESERRVQQWIDEYVALAPAIAAARPLMPTAETRVELTGVDRIVDGVRRALRNNVGTTVSVLQDAVVADVPVAPGVDPYRHGAYLADYLLNRGNVGRFEHHVRARDGHIVLVRRGVAGPGVAWAAAGARAAKFFNDPAYREQVFDTCRIRQTRRTAKGMEEKRFPTVLQFGEDSRGGTVTLALPDDFPVARVEAGETALRQVLRLPDLVVDRDRMRPVIRLRSRAVTRDLPTLAVLRPEMLVRPRSIAARHAASGDFALPIGVRVDADTGAPVPILANQAVTPHLGVFGGSGAGKTTLLATMVKAAVLQGAEVILWDAKLGVDMRNLALANLPGVVHYASGSAAVLHRTILMVRHEFERRQALAGRLAHRGVRYVPAPMLVVMDEAPAWLNDQVKRGGAAKRAADQTLAHISYIASQAREMRVYLLTAGQFSYVSAFAGEWKTNTRTLVLLGPPSEINRQSLFVGEQRQQVTTLGATISPRDRGVGLVCDPDTGSVERFRGFYTPAGAALDHLDAEVAKAPRLRRYAYRLPRGSEPGGDGTWADWTPISDPSSDSLPVRILDRPDGTPDPAAVLDDPTSPAYAPGAKPMPQVHDHATSYDQK